MRTLKIFIYVAATGLSCGMQNLQFPNQGLNLGPLHWEDGVLATGPPGMSLEHFLKDEINKRIDVMFAL